MANSLERELMILSTHFAENTNGIWNIRERGKKVAIDPETSNVTKET